MNSSGSKLKPLLGLLAFAVLAVMMALIKPSATFPASLGSGSLGADRLIWLVGVMLGAYVLKSWTPKYAHLGSLGLVLAYLLGSAGLVEVATVVLWLASVSATGALVLRWCYSSGKDADISATEAFVVGTAIWMAALGVMMHFPVNFRGFHLGVLLLPFLCLHGLPAQTATSLRSKALGFHAWMQSIPFWAFCLGLAIIGWSVRWAAFPSMAYDDHAGHLRLWTELLTERRALFDVKGQIWAVAPFASDLIYAGISLVAGADARSAINLMLAIALLALIARVLHQMRAPAWVQWLLVVLMATTPMLGNLLLTMQTELALAVIGMASLRLVLNAKGGWRGQYVLGILACSAMCAAIKLPGVIFGATMLLALAVNLWMQRGPARTASAYLKWPALIVIIVLAFVSAHSYANAWLTTGNPLFPLYNAIFKSPFAPVSNFSDPRWIHGFGIRSYVRAFFHTSEFFEGGNYTAGWQYLVMLPLALAAVWTAPIPSRLRLAIVPLLGFGFAMFAATQYWRYVFPVMPIACVTMAALFIGKNRTVRNASLALAILCILANLAFYHRVSWMMGAPAGTAYTQAEKQVLVSQYAPVAVLTGKVNQMAPGSRVLYPEDTPFGASLHGTPLYVNWYSPARSAQFAALKTPADVAAFLQQDRIDFAVLGLGDADTSNLPKKLLREHIAQYGTAVAQEGTYILYSLQDAPTVYRKAFDLKQPGDIALLMPVTPQGVLATAQPRVLANLPVFRSRQARFGVKFNCPAKTGYFIAQINWDKGAPYYRLVACEAGGTFFDEAVPIPPGSTRAELYATVRDSDPVQVEKLTVELN